MITSRQIDDAIKSVEYYHFRGTTQTACCCTLQNGYSVVGTSAASDPDEFDITLGQKYAREDANLKVATLLAFVEREIKGEMAAH